MPGGVLVMSRLGAFLRDDSGTAKIEYGLVISIVSVAAVIAFEAMGETLISLFDNVATTLDAGD